MIKQIFLVFLFIAATETFAQTTLTWDELGVIKFDITYVEKYDEYFLKPTFSEKIKAQEGKKITVTGYFLDIAAGGEILLLSQNPMASCFYCGAAGPESIIEVNFIEKPSFKTDEIVAITGVLELNQFDVDHFNYILNEATGKLID